MAAKKSKSLDGNSEFADLWVDFKLLPWLWADRLISKSQYMVGLVIITYILLAIVSYGPGMGRRSTLLLISHPSIALILLGWIVVIVLAIRWRHTIPAFFQWIWERKQADLKTPELRNEFTRYIRTYQSRLLSKKEPLLISFFLLVLFVAFIFAANFPNYISAFYTPLAVGLTWSIVLIAMIFIIMIGFMSWALYITSEFFRKLTKRFPLPIEPTHPDECGGLKPLGDFWFNIAMPIIGGGYVLAAVPVLNLDIDYTLNILSVLALLIVVLPLSILAVFFPLWDIHLQMEDHKNKYSNEYAVQAKELEQTILVNTHKDGKVTEAKNAREKLEILQTLHPAKIAYPTWPIKVTKTILSIFSPQMFQAALEIIKQVYSLIDLNLPFS